MEVQKVEACIFWYQEDTAGYGCSYLPCLEGRGQETVYYRSNPPSDHLAENVFGIFKGLRKGICVRDCVAT